MVATILQANARAIPLADKSVHCVATSPPYWALRDYGHTGDEWPAGEYRTIGGVVSVPAMRCPLGLEPTPDAFVWHMLLIFREVKRVLRDDGTCWVNIGDSYNAGTSAPSGASKTADVGGWATRTGTAIGSARTNARGLKTKDLVGIPWMLAFALRADGWYLRQDIIWAKPNPMPESVRDRCTKAHEYLFLLAKSDRYYFDGEAIRTPLADSSKSRLSQNVESQAGSVRANGGAKTNGAMKAVMFGGNKAAGYGTRIHSGNEWVGGVGANKRSVWKIATESCREAHFATYPTKLVEPCILAGTSAKGVCPECGAQWRRIVDKARVATRPGDGSKTTGDRMTDGNRDPQRHVAIVTGETWVPGCKCGVAETVPAIVFDPFNGAGTTGITATRHGRRYVGTELSSEYIAITLRRWENDRPKKASRPRVARPALRLVGQFPLFAEAS